MDATEVGAFTRILQKVGGPGTRGRRERGVTLQCVTFQESRFV